MGRWQCQQLAREGGLGASQRGSLTGVERECAPALPVHVVDQAAGEWLEQQAEDGHAGAEAPRVREAGPRVEDTYVDDVQEDGGRQSTQKLQDRTAQGPGVTACHPSLQAQ